MILIVDRFWEGVLMVFMQSITVTWCRGTWLECQESYSCQVVSKVWNYRLEIKACGMEKECEAERVAGHRIFEAREFRTCRAHLIRVICRGFRPRIDTDTPDKKYSDTCLFFDHLIREMQLQRQFMIISLFYAITIFNRTLWIPWMKFMRWNWFVRDNKRQ